MAIEHDVIYVISAALVFIATMQRSKHEETINEHNILYLPLFTILAMIMLHLSIIYVPTKILNSCFMTIFIITGFYALVTNTFFFIELTEYEVEEIIYHEEVSDSEFSFILIDGKHHKKHNRKKMGVQIYLKTWYKALKKAIMNMKPIDMCVYLFASLVSFSYLYTKDNNIAQIISISICFTSIREVKIFSVINGYTILAIYFCYNMIWVSFEDTLKTYTSGIDVPIKLVLPMTLHGYDIVGFGDVLIPAFFIAICKKYGEARNCISFWYVSYASFCVSILIAMQINWVVAEEKLMLIIICPIVGVITLLHAAILGRTKDFIMYKRNT